MVRKYLPQIGDIVKTNFNPSKGHEQQGFRPGLIVSNDLLNENTPFVWVAPISHDDYNIPIHVKLDGRTKTDGSIFVEQIITLDANYRKLKFIEKAPTDIVDEVLSNIKEISSR